MTFGEHLEELRQALWKSILALVVGVVIAFLFAKDVLLLVQSPLQQALDEYYVRMSRNAYKDHLMSAGGAIPKDVDAAADFFAKQRLIMEEHWIDPYELLDVLKKVAPQAIDVSKLPARRSDAVVDRDKLAPLTMYHPVEKDSRARIIALDAAEPVMIYIKSALLLGATIASPVIFYFLWQFVAAGLYPHERRYVHIFLPFSTGLFLAGAALAFFVVFKFVLRFLFIFAAYLGIDLQPRITEWMSFVLILPLGFGIAFQLPLIMLFLERIGIMTIKTYLGNWRISVMVIAFLALVFTPSDPYSMMLMMLPLIGLYFFGIMLCYWMPRRTSEFGAAID
jgi:sec-independent protein translocase protein TatC